MARTLTPKDASNIINLLWVQMTGQQAGTTIDPSDFVSAGELVMSYGPENVLNALTMILGRTMIATRPYSMAFASLNAISTGAYSHRIRKISYYAKYCLEAGYQNTDLTLNFAPYLDNGSNGGTSTASMWEQHPGMPLEVNFAGSSIWQDCITTYEDKLETAFRSPEDFNAFISGIVQEKLNDIEQQKEAFARMTFLNHVAGAVLAEGVLQNGMAYNLTTEYNAWYNTNYSTQQLQTTQLESFLKFFTAFIANLKRDFKDRDTLHHWPVQYTDSNSVDWFILRHTPGDKFRGIFNARFFTMAEANVFSTVFNEQYLEGGQGYELVNYWQSKDAPFWIDVEPGIPDFDGTHSGLQSTGSQVTLDCLLGVVYDVDGMMIDFQLDKVLTSPLEARKGYYNTWYTIQRNAITDLTEKIAVLYMADEDDGGDEG